EGTWAAKDGGNKVGYAALPGLTLLECGLPASHPVIQAAASHIALSLEKLKGTYELSLSIMFLDRLTAYSKLPFEKRIELEARSRRLIQVLALRLIAGQTETGGWGYECPLLTDAQATQLLNVLGQSRPNLRTFPAFIRKLPAFQDST